jgi:hypothetical protein
LLDVTGQDAGARASGPVFSLLANLCARMAYAASRGSPMCSLNPHEDTFSRLSNARPRRGSHGRVVPPPVSSGGCGAAALAADPARPLHRYMLNMKANLRDECCYRRMQITSCTVLSRVHFCLGDMPVHMPVPWHRRGTGNSISERG